MGKQRKEKQQSPVECKELYSISTDKTHEKEKEKDIFYVHKLNQIAVAMYGAIDPREYETYRMRQAFQNEHPQTELDAGLIAMNIDAVRTDSDGNVQIILKNGQIIERGENR